MSASSAGVPSPSCYPRRGFARGAYSSTNACVIFAAAAPAGNAMFLDEFGNTPFGAAGWNVWTGTEAGGGSAAETCTGWTITGDFEYGLRGDATGGGSGWTDAGLDSCSAALRLYCIEQ